MLGQVFLGKYRAIRLLDKGGMSNIYLATDGADGAEVAVKVLQDQLVKNVKAVEHLRREIHIMSRFEHPGTVRVLDADPHERPSPVLVLEYLQGTDLGQLLRREGRMSAERAGRLLVQLCDVLGAAHAAGIVHRDIKPGNLMVLQPSTPVETIKLMDFGLARMASLLYIAADEVKGYAPPSVAGTPEYIAPEEALGRASDHRADLYSAGVVLYEMLAGTRPFLCSLAEQLLEAHAYQQPPPFDQVLGTGHGVPRAVEVVVRRCLSKHPDDRFASAGDLASAYEAAVGRPLRHRWDDDDRSSHAAEPASHGSRLNGATRALPRAAPATCLTRRPGPGDPHAFRHRLEADMLEAMAILKLKGFVHDLGGEVVESLPGMIRVRLAEATARPSGLFRWLGGASTSAPSTTSELELYIQRRDPTKPNRLTITLLIHPPTGQPTPQWRTRCERTARDLQAYLISR